jgi:hypothetical protein
MNTPGESLNDPALRLAQVAEELGLTPDQGAVLLRNQAADERVRADSNLSVIEEQGRIEGKFDLRLVPYAATLTLSLDTLIDPENLKYFQRDVTLVKGVGSFIHTAVSGHTATVKRKVFGGEELKYTNPHSTELNEEVFLAGALFDPIKSAIFGNSRKYRASPHIAKMGSLVCAKLETLQVQSLAWGETVDERYVIDAGKATVAAATIDYADHERVVVFGKPYNLA